MKGIQEAGYVCVNYVLLKLFLIYLLAYECVRKYELHLSRVQYTLHNCARFYIRHGRTGFQRSPFNAFKPTDML